MSLKIEFMMTMYPGKMKSSISMAALFLVTFGAGGHIALAQTADTSGNAFLKGSYHFRHVAIQNVDGNYNPTEITASFGTITFDGAGNYVIAGTSVDNTISSGSPQTLAVTAKYAIGSNGIGYLVNPIYPSDPDSYIYGAVAQGVFTGSSTESEQDGNIFNDIFVALPAAAASTNASFTSSYQTGVLDFAGAGVTAIKNALFNLSPNGQGAFGVITLNGQASNQSANSLTQSVTGATYNFNTDGSATLTIPLPSSGLAANALFTGSKTLFQSGDGNFILGWTPGGYDIFFGVRTLASAASNSASGGLFFTSALENAPGSSGTDSYYGSTKIFGDAGGDGILHQRLNLPLTSSIDYGSDDQISLNSSGTTGVDFLDYEYVFGDGQQAFVGIGTFGFYSLVVGLKAPTFTGSGVYLNPVGVVNAASYQPVTASLAPGELITLFGSGLASANVTAAPGSFPMSLGGVTATIDSISCPIYYVSPTQMAVVVPYGVASNQTGLANIQVTNNGVASNIVQMYLTDASPGSFSQNVEGIGLAAALHAATNQLITAANPAQPGEFISLYLTGLGPVSPAIADGAAGPSNPLSYADVYNAGNLAVYFNDYGSNGSTGNSGTVQFAGLAPTLTGLYQINVQVPTSGLASGDNVYIEFVTDAADVNQIQIPYGSSSAGINAAPVRDSRVASRAKAISSLRTRPRSHPSRRPALAPESTR